MEDRAKYYMLRRFDGLYLGPYGEWGDVKSGSWYDSEGQAFEALEVNEEFHLEVELVKILWLKAFQ